MDGGEEWYMRVIARNNTDYSEEDEEFNEWRRDGIICTGLFMFAVGISIAGVGAYLHFTR